jgi:hypothetical protein
MPLSTGKAERGVLQKVDSMQCKRLFVQKSDVHADVSVELDTWLRQLGTRILNLPV